MQMSYYYFFCDLYTEPRDSRVLSGTSKTLCWHQTKTQEGAQNTEKSSTRKASWMPTTHTINIKSAALSIAKYGSQITFLSPLPSTMGVLFSFKWGFCAALNCRLANHNSPAHRCLRRRHWNSSCCQQERWDSAMGDLPFEHCTLRTWSQTGSAANLHNPNITLCLFPQYYCK